MAARKKTVGLSPKAPAASVAALAAPLLARLLADALGVEVGSEAAEGIILAAIAAVSALGAAFLAPPGNVVTDRKPKSTPSKEAGEMMMGAGKQKGYGLVEAVLVIFIVLVILIVLLRLV